STFTSLPDMGARVYPFLPVRFLCRFSYNTLALMTEIRCPVLVIHSPDDEIVPFEFGREIFDRTMSPKDFLVISGDHNEGFLLTGKPYITGLKSFIEKFPAM
ncbi:MAG: alpha/beta hydrolase, partial [Candidatus Wallbacteria bacterium]|nr:alpha/beta hydrolase [Candidatus Wallbacteria bacterium]